MRNHLTVTQDLWYANTVVTAWGTLWGKRHRFTELGRRLNQSLLSTRRAKGRFWKHKGVWVPSCPRVCAWVVEDMKKVLDLVTWLCASQSVRSGNQSRRGGSWPSAVLTAAMRPYTLVYSTHSPLGPDSRSATAHLRRTTHVAFCGQILLMLLKCVQILCWQSFGCFCLITEWRNREALVDVTAVPWSSVAIFKNPSFQ